MSDMTRAFGVVGACGAVVVKSGMGKAPLPLMAISALSIGDFQHRLKNKGPRKYYSM